MTTSRKTRNTVALAQDEKMFFVLQALRHLFHLKEQGSKYTRIGTMYSDCLIAGS